MPFLPISDGERKCEAGFAEALAGLLRKMAQHCASAFESSVSFAERVIMRNRFRLRVNHEFIGIAAARLAISAPFPIARNRFQFFLWHGPICSTVSVPSARNARSVIRRCPGSFEREGVRGIALRARAQPTPVRAVLLIGRDSRPGELLQSWPEQGRCGRLRDRSKQFVRSG